MPKHIAILGSTGSIGRQCLEVIRAHPGQFVVEVLTARTDAVNLITQAIEFRPNAVVIVDEKFYPEVHHALNPLDIKVFTGEESLAQVVEFDDIDMVLTALVGYVGLKPTLNAIRAGKHIALANKETLVVAGELVTSMAARYKVNILPVDSEHSAIFQCLAGERLNKVEKIILTGSGGPFRGKSIDFLEKVSVEEALKHPVWSMGRKITIDSASLMNKGLEVIEASWLFSLKPEQIEVIIHPQSIIHSMVQFEDGSIKAQMGLPDMRLPIQYALAYPVRLPSSFDRFDFYKYPEFTFEQPDLRVFRNLTLAYEALRIGGNSPCILNAANEVVVEAFLRKKISFLQMPDIIEHCLRKIGTNRGGTLEDFIETDKETRIMAESLI
jgi:1-deoxy-D-xylulose-5-phosphate reductoisomerase